MSNGHKPGIEFNGNLVGITDEAATTFKPEAEDVARLIKYFSEYPTAKYHVTATVVSDAGSTGDIPETPESGA